MSESPTVEVCRSNSPGHSSDKGGVASSAVKDTSIILDIDHIPEGISANLVKFPNEELTDFYLRVTHLHHQNQR